jgi:hypothetical protein
MWDEVPRKQTDEEIINALTSQQRPKALLPVPEGMRVGNRLDINAYVKKNPPVHVDTVHDVSSSKNTPISYNRTGHLSDVEFSSNPDAFYRVGLGTKEQALTPMGVERGMGKTPQAMIKGTNIGTHDDEVRRMLAEMLQDPAYTQVGMDPRIGSQFYDKATDRPIWTSGEKFQSGPLVMVPKKDIETTDWNDPRLELKDFPGKTYAEGGLTGYAPGGKIVKGALDALTKASEGKMGQVADKNLTTLQDFHTSLGDSIAARVKEAQDKIAAANFKYKTGDRVFTDWTAKNNYPPYEILGQRILGGKFGAILRDPATGKALRDENGKALREAEHVGYQVRHDYTPHGETEPSWRIHTMPETSLKGLIEPEEPYKKGGKVKKK